MNANYYDMIAPIALSYVEAYQTDITKHDYETLNWYSGAFIYAMRKTGTNIILLSGEIDSNTAEWLEAFTFTSNDRFFIGENSRIREVEKSKAWKLWKEYEKNHVYSVPRKNILFG